MPSRHANFTILAIDPCRKGFGFAVLEARGFLLSWGVAELYSTSDAEFLVRLDLLVREEKPDLICVEDTSGKRRGERMKRRVAMAAGCGRRRGIQVAVISGQDVRTALILPRKATKYEVAERLAKSFPELDPIPKRKPWQSERERMNVFDALALGYAALQTTAP